MIRQNAGKIINLSGAGSPLPYPMFSAYATSKVGVLGLTQTLAEEVKKYNIQVNVIAPGPVDTRLQDEILLAGESAGEGALKRARETKRTGGVPPSKAAALAVFLASDDSDGLTGRFLSAVWDNWQGLGEKDALAELIGGQLFTLRRIDGVLFGPIDKKQHR
jgi:NAD(P)-dependent dehydrogenase (short-subunit alcohol dehydrogenase family)